MRAWTVAIASLWLVSCSGQPGGPDGSDGNVSNDSGDGSATLSDGDAGGHGDGGVRDGGSPDGGFLDSGFPDGHPGDGHLSDAPSVDTGHPDSGQLDAGHPDSGPTDAGRADVGSGADVGTRPDVPPADTGGCALAVNIVQPPVGASIETCTTGAMQRIYYDFEATVAGGIPTSVQFAWRDPQGNLTAPAFSTTSAPPTQVTYDIGTMRYVAHRQVGGYFVAGDVTPLASFGSHGSSIGTWQVIVSVTGACSPAPVERSFDLTFTNHGCPN
jgi:hypothetical protein